MRKSIEKYSASLVEKSSQMYEELLGKEIIPHINLESSDELSTTELANVVGKLDETVQTYIQKSKTVKIWRSANDYVR